MLWAPRTRLSRSTFAAGGGAFATRYTYGVGSVAAGGSGAMPDIANSGCMILWGYNPSYTRITHATAVVEALKRGMRLIVIDPRRVGLADKADLRLRVRPSTDGALALGIANLMIERGWFDRDFIRDWSNGPLCRVIVDDQMEFPRGRELAVDLIEKTDEFLMPMAAHVSFCNATYRSGGLVQAPRPSRSAPIGAFGSRLLPVILMSGFQGRSEFVRSPLTARGIDGLCTAGRGGERRRLTRL